MSIQSVFGFPTDLILIGGMVEIASQVKLVVHVSFCFKWLVGSMVAELVAALRAAEVPHLRKMITKYSFRVDERKWMHW